MIELLEHLGAKCTRPRHLDRRRVARHHDGGGHAQSARRPGHALRMVAAGHRHHATGAFGGVKVGQPVTLKVKNQATFIPHNLIIKALEAGIDVKLDLSAGKSGEVSFTPTKAGSYEIICDKAPPIGKSHKEKGMHGTLLVE